MQIVKDYRDNKVLRDSFNELAKKAFETIGDVILRFMRMHYPSLKYFGVF